MNKNAELNQIDESNEFSHRAVLRTGGSVSRILKRPQGSLAKHVPFSERPPVRLTRPATPWGLDVPSSTNSSVGEQSLRSPLGGDVLCVCRPCSIFWQRKPSGSFEAAFGMPLHNGV